MSGNVFEWQANYNDVKNGWLGLRGGSGLISGDGARVSFRNLNHPNLRFDLIGFRLVVSLPNG